MYRRRFLKGCPVQMTSSSYNEEDIHMVVLANSLPLKTLSRSALISKESLSHPHAAWNQYATSRYS